mmetsp:Transcript_20438/g.35131  ORF Transcript_20438/g.35131 Transcript_20438/m.35131 type:complete len:376 (-) Transcript_20438:943-2070(-)|eukprot:CAMPEP_0196653654 /NCGR_PEP_ID=MMETSP1086-20130531/3307_1 /TAXON_ID=77921 /ORGANISM="Cyanoptyche  gloeocystis , Strain SAG4.97" /LENGTH=375 /DNA_ID=CAMNT_0041984967 /DNA_START=134 /DNA_END=1261 /DNA_ORIENTATION=-
MSDVPVKNLSLDPATAGIRVIPDRGTVCPTGWADTEYDRSKKAWRVPAQATDRLRSPLSPSQLVMCGALAGTIAKPVVSPLDVVRTRSQVLGMRSPYNHLFSAIQKIYREEGYRALFKGNGAACLRLAPYSGTKFMAFEYFKSMLTDDDGKVSNTSRFVAGGIAGMCAVLSTYPLEVVKIRLTLQTTNHRGTAPYNGIADCLFKIARHEGMKGLYGGLVPTILGEILYEGAVFVAYESLKDMWSRHLLSRGETRQLGAVDHLFLGSVAGGIAQLSAYPLDVVRKRMMARVKAGQTNGMRVGYAGMLDCLAVMIREEGLMSLYRGTGACLLKIVPYAAVMFAAYEQAKRSFEMYNQWVDNQALVGSRVPLGAMSTY